MPGVELRDQVILIIHNKRKKVKKRQSNAPGRTEGERGERNTLLEKDNGTKLRHILSTSVPFNTSLESL